MNPDSLAPERKVFTTGPHYFFTNRINKFQGISVVKKPKQGNRVERKEMGDGVGSCRSKRMLLEDLTREVIAE